MLTDLLQIFANLSSENDMLLIVTFRFFIMIEVT